VGANNFGGVFLGCSVATTRKEGIHQLRHYYASVMLAEGVSIKELAEYLGHSDPGFTLRVYAHMLPCSHDRPRRDQPTIHPGYRG
jgi:integrase